MTDLKILQKYFSPFERCITLPTIAYDRNLLLKYWRQYKRNLGYGEDIRLVHFFAKKGKFLENQDSGFLNIGFMTVKAVQVFRYILV